MLAFAVLPLLGTGLFVWIFDYNDDDEAISPAPPEQVGTDSEDTLNGTGDDLITGFRLPVSDGFETGEDDLAGDLLNGDDGNHTITGNLDDTVTGGGGADLIRSIGIDQPDGGGVTVTDFDPAEDTLLLASSSGPDLSWDADDDRYQISQASNGTDTNLFFEDELLAVLQNNDAAALAADTSWLANVRVEELPGVVDGTEGDDTIAGTGAADRISGLCGDDEIRGLGSDDTVNGGDGDDFLIGGPTPMI